MPIFSILYRVTRMWLILYAGPFVWALANGFPSVSTSIRKAKTYNMRMFVGSFGDLCFWQACLQCFFFVQLTRIDAKRTERAIHLAHAMTETKHYKRSMLHLFSIVFACEWNAQSIFIWPNIVSNTFWQLFGTHVHQKPFPCLFMQFWSNTKVDYVRTQKWIMCAMHIPVWRVSRLTKSISNHFHCNQICWE